MGGTELAVGLDPSESIQENGNGHIQENYSGNNQENGSEHNGETVRPGENGNGHTGENGSEKIQENGNGHTGADVDPRFPCGRPSCSILATKKCSKCRAVYYCSRQALHKRKTYMAHQKSLKKATEKKYFEVSLTKIL